MTPEIAYIAYVAYYTESYDRDKKESSRSTIAGGHRLTFLNHSLFLYFEHPTLMRSHANSHSLSASSPRPSDQ